MPIDVGKSRLICSGLGLGTWLAVFDIRACERYEMRKNKAKSISISKADCEPN